MKYISTFISISVFYFKSVCFGKHFLNQKGSQVEKNDRNEQILKYNSERKRSLELEHKMHLQIKVHEFKAS